jgi:pimeloyl-ACP methyl ester carboxylesterase
MKPGLASRASLAEPAEGSGRRGLKHDHREQQERDHVDAGAIRADLPELDQLDIEQVKNEHHADYRSAEACPVDQRRRRPPGRRRADSGHEQVEHKPEHGHRDPEDVCLWTVLDQDADGQLWADDVAAVIDQTGLEQPTLVAWSYGGYIVADYLRAYGDARIGAVNLVGAAVILKPPTFDHIGPGFLDNAPDMCVPDLATNITATRRFLRACTSRPLDDDEMAAAVAWNMAVPPAVRGALLSRELDGRAHLASISVPVLVTHGRDDVIVRPSMAEHTLSVCPAATVSWHHDVGHMPFWEASDRFDRELADLARTTTGAAAARQRT